MILNGDTALHCAVSYLQT